jgi:hypothetical protein
MSTDQPDAKKPLEGPIDPKKIAAVEKPPLEKAALTATERWHSELAKLPSSVKFTLTLPADSAEKGLPLMLASAEVPKNPQAKGPGAEVKAPAPEIKAAPANQAPPVEAKPVAKENSFMSALRWGENKANAAVATVTDAVTHADRTQVLETSAIVVGTAVIARFGGAALEEGALGKYFKGAEAENGIAGKIFEGKTVTSARAAIRATETEATVQSFNAQLNAAKKSAVVEFGSSSSVTVTPGESLAGTRLPKSAPVMDLSITRPLNRPVPFRVSEPVVTKIPVGLKASSTLESAGTTGLQTGRTTIGEFSAEPRRIGSVPTVRLAPEPGSNLVGIKAPEVATVPAEPGVPAARHMQTVPGELHPTEPPVQIRRVEGAAGETATPRSKVEGATGETVTAKAKIESPTGQVITAKPKIELGQGETGTVPGRVQVRTDIAGAPESRAATVARAPEPAAARIKAADEPAAIQPGVVRRAGELTPDALKVDRTVVESTSAARGPDASEVGSSEVVQAKIVHPPGVTPVEGTPLRSSLPSDRLTARELDAAGTSKPLTRVQGAGTHDLPNTVATDLKAPTSEGTAGLATEAQPRIIKVEPAADAPVNLKAADQMATVRADLTTETGIATESRSAVQQSSSQLKTLQNLPGLSPQAAQAARTLESSLGKMTAEGAESMTVSARAQAMADIEKGLQNLKVEVKGVESAEQSLSGIENGVTRLRAANDAAITQASATTTKTVAADLKLAVEKIPNVEPQVAQSINQSLERIAAPEATAVERQTALNELSTSVEKLRTTSDPQTLRALEQQVTELRGANLAGDTVKAQTAFETSATRLGDAAEAVRTNLGSAPASAEAESALLRIEQNSASLTASRASSVVERQAAMQKIEADMAVLKGEPAVAAQVPQLERELAAMRTSESTVNLLKSEATFAEAAPKFSSSIDEALAKPGITAAERTQLETLRTTATQLEPSTYSALSAADRATVLTDAESQIANLERQSGEAARLRESFNEVKNSASELETARTASLTEESTATTLRTSSTADPSLSQGTTQPTVPLKSTLEPAEAPVSTQLSERLPAAIDRAGVTTEAEIAGAAEKPGALTSRMASTADNTALSSSEAAAARANTFAETEAAATKAARDGGQEVASMSSEARAAEARLADATIATPESRLAAQSGVVLKDSAANVAESTEALKNSLNAAAEYNTKGALAGDASLTADKLAEMQRALAADTPDIATLKKLAAALPSDAATSLSARINELDGALQSHNQLVDLDTAIKTLDSSTHSLSVQLEHINIPGIASTIADLKSGVVSLSEAKDRVASLTTMAQKLSTLSPQYSEVSSRLGASLDALHSANAKVNARLVDVINTQVARAGDLSDLAQAKNALQTLTRIVPGDSATSQLIKSASDQLTQAENLQRAADAALEAKRSVFASPSFEQQKLPVQGLLQSKFLSLQGRADAIAAAFYPRSFAAATTPLLLAGGLGIYSYEGASAASGTISSPKDLASNPIDKSAIAVNNAGSGESSISNQAAFSAKTEAALSPLTQAMIEDRNILYNLTLAPNWEAQNQALGYFLTPFSPETPQAETPQTFFAPVRKLALSTSTAGNDTKPRLVYPGFAQKQLDALAAKRHFGGLRPSVFADNSTGVRGLGTGLAGGPQSGLTSRIPTGLSKLLTREIISNGLDASNETAGTATSPSANGPNTPAVSLSLANEDNNGAKGVQGASTAANSTSSIVPNRAKSLAV